MKLLNAVTPDVSRTWIAGLADKSADEIKLGLDKARDFDGFFNLPAFREMCAYSPEDLGIPSVEAGYAEASHYSHTRTFSHPGLYWVAKQTGWHEIKTQRQERVFPRWKKFYAEMVERVKLGEVFEAPAQHEAVEHKPNPTLEDSPGRKEFLKLKESLHRSCIEKGYKREEA